MIGGFTGGSLLFAAVLKLDAGGRLGFLSFQSSRIEGFVFGSGLGLLAEKKKIIIIISDSI
jgi:hypothetical protein